MLKTWEHHRRIQHPVISWGWQMRDFGMCCRAQKVSCGWVLCLWMVFVGFSQLWGSLHLGSSRFGSHGSVWFCRRHVLHCSHSLWSLWAGIRLQVLRATVGNLYSSGWEVLSNQAAKYRHALGTTLMRQGARAITHACEFQCSNRSDF